VEERFLDLATAKRKLDEALERAGKSGLFALRDQTLAGHLADFRAQSESSGNEAVNRIQGALGDLPWTNSLRVDIQEKLKGFQQTLKAQAGLPPATETNLLKLDASLFRYCLGEDSLRSYARRFDAYTKAREFGQRSLPDMRQEVGKGWQFLTQIAQQAGAIGTSPDLYPRTCAYGAELRDTVKGLLEQGEASIRQNFVQEYARHVTGQVQGFADTPDFPVELATLEAAAKVLAGAARDSGSPPAQLEPAQVSLLDQLSERIKQTRIRLVDKFVSRASNELQAGLGFPVLRDAPKNLNVDELNGIRRTIAALDKSCASTVVQELERATGAESLKALKRRVETCRRVLDFLVDTSGNLRSFHVKVDPVDNQVEVLGRHRGMSVSRDGRGAEEKIDQGKEFPALALDQTMAIVSRPYPGSTEQPEVNNLAAWAPLRLLAAAGTSWKGASNHVWKWSFQIRKPAATAAYDLVPQDTLTVQFVFEKPLALLDDWPSSADW
jgi:hypothetical protein